MILFSTRCMQHIVSKLPIPQPDYTITNFSDQELHVEINEVLTDKTVWIIASTQSPAQNIIELFFLLNAIKRAGAAKINLIISYFAYARQLHPTHNQAASAHVISNFLNGFSVDHLYIIHPHDSGLHRLMTFTDITPMHFFYNKAKLYDAIAATDQGSHALATHIAQHCNKEVILLSKKRIDHTTIEITDCQGSVRNKTVLLVDDIISTGNSIIKAAHSLKQKGARTVSAAATHGIFSANAFTDITHSEIDTMYVTNSIQQRHHAMIEVTDLSAWILQTIQANP